MPPLTKEIGFYFLDTVHALWRGMPKEVWLSGYCTYTLIMFLKLSVTEAVAPAPLIALQHPSSLVLLLMQEQTAVLLLLLLEWHCSTSSAAVAAVTTTEVVIVAGRKRNYCC